MKYLKTFCLFAYLSFPLQVFPASTSDKETLNVVFNSHNLTGRHKVFLLMLKIIGFDVPFEEQLLTAPQDEDQNIKEIIFSDLDLQCETVRGFSTNHILLIQDKAEFFTEIDQKKHGELIISLAEKKDVLSIAAFSGLGLAGLSCCCDKIEEELSIKEISSLEEFCHLVRTSFEEKAQLIMNDKRNFIKKIKAISKIPSFKPIPLIVSYQKTQAEAHLLMILKDLIEPFCIKTIKKSLAQAESILHQ